MRYREDMIRYKEWDTVDSLGNGRELTKLLVPSLRWSWHESSVNCTYE